MERFVRPECNSSVNGLKEIDCTAADNQLLRTSHRRIESFKLCVSIYNTNCLFPTKFWVQSNVCIPKSKKHGHCQVTRPEDCCRECEFGFIRRRVRCHLTQEIPEDWHPVEGKPVQATLFWRNVIKLNDTRGESWRPYSYYCMVIVTSSALFQIWQSSHKAKVGFEQRIHQRTPCCSWWLDAIRKWARKC